MRSTAAGAVANHFEKLSEEYRKILLHTARDEDETVRQRRITDTLTRELDL